jgi:hypothetical protein
MTQGYPKIVSVSKISSRVDVETYFEGEKKAVALAPGVWTNLPDGAELEDAVANEALIGLCASIDAFERQNPDICRAVALAGEGSRCDPLVTAVLARIWYADRDRRTRCRYGGGQATSRLVLPQCPGQAVCSHEYRCTSTRSVSAVPQGSVSAGVIGRLHGRRSAAGCPPLAELPKRAVSRSARPPTGQRRRHAVCRWERGVMRWL